MNFQFDTHSASRALSSPSSHLVAIPPDSLAHVPEFQVRRRPPNGDYEIVDGMMHLIPTPSRVHKSICSAIEKTLRDHLACSLEQVFTMRDKRPLCTERSTLFPDFWVSTLSIDPIADRRVAHPGLVIVILSSSSVRTDNVARIHAYRTIETLKELLVIDPAQRHSELYTRINRNTWVMTDIEDADEIHLETIGLTLTGTPGLIHKGLRRSLNSPETSR
ncbi:Uma2 family endonuclease [Thauera sp. 2A1]|uniref:Uma2 family endonuclease n=1 Tax=Thauera sp. 2A1 TaxID=2570191 RepID=UPI001884B3B0